MTCIRDRYPCQIGSVLYALSIISITSAHAETCKGDIPQVHNVGNFHFETNSWVEHGSPFTKYVTCIHNLDSTDIQVNWFIPGPHKMWIPPDQVAIQPRMSDDPSEKPVQGCVEYGNLGEKTVAQFYGSSADLSASQSESEQSCRQAAGAVAVLNKAFALPNERWEDNTVIYFPSDPNKPQETMLKVIANFGLSSNGGGSVQSFFTYTAERYAGRSAGNPESIKLKALFSADNPYLNAAFDKQFSGKTIGLKESGNVVWSINGKYLWNTTNAYYEFTDEFDRVLAVIQIPMVKPVSK